MTATDHFRLMRYQNMLQSTCENQMSWVKRYLHIISFQSVPCRWGLRFMEWSSNASALLEHRSVRLIYDEAMILLREQGIKIK